MHQKSCRHGSLVTLKITNDNAPIAAFNPISKSALSLLLVKVLESTFNLSPIRVEGLGSLLSKTPIYSVEVYTILRQVGFLDSRAETAHGPNRLRHFKSEMSYLT